MSRFYQENARSKTKNGNSRWQILDALLRLIAASLPLPLLRRRSPPRDRASNEGAKGHSRVGGSSSMHSEHSEHK